MSKLTSFVRLSAEEVSLAFRQIENGAGAVSLSKLQNFVQQVTGTEISVTQLRDVMNLMDSEQKGRVTFEDVVRLMDTEPIHLQSSKKVANVQRSEPKSPFLTEVGTVDSDDNGSSAVVASPLLAVPNPRRSRLSVMLIDSQQEIRALVQQAAAVQLPIQTDTGNGSDAVLTPVPPSQPRITSQSGSSLLRHSQIKRDVSAGSSIATEVTPKKVSFARKSSQGEISVRSSVLKRLSMSYQQAEKIMARKRLEEFRKLQSDERQLLAALFSRFDRDGDGVLDPEEYRVMLRTVLDVDLSDGELHCLMVHLCNGGSMMQGLDQDTFARINAGTLHEPPYIESECEAAKNAKSKKKRSKR
eukprot:GILK01002619.1.p1 GENE.GILK01002619.1~~GILK01002619.1.p1  ORF type:complete len:357 (+),score=78.54 GILK01002619.1:34-1104(+)